MIVIGPDLEAWLKTLRCAFLLDDQYRQVGASAPSGLAAQQQGDHAARRPCEAMTIRSQPSVLAWSMMASQACSASTVKPLQAALGLGVYLRCLTRALARRSCAS